MEASRAQLKEAGKSEVKAAEQVEADFTVEAIFVGIEKGDFPEGVLGLQRNAEAVRAVEKLRRRGSW